MGILETEHQRQAAAAAARAGPIVAFDFDGTITVRDSFRAFLRWRAGRFGYAFGLVRLAPAAVRWLFDRNLSRLKAAMVRVYLRGVSRDELERQATEFAAAAAPMLLRPDALKVWRRHRQDGCRMVIVTASPEPIVAPFARGLGADLLLGTRLAYKEDGRVAGGLDGSNCRGAEKVRRLKAVFGEDMYLAVAYGDTDGDRELLAMAEEEHLRLFAGRPTTPMSGT